MPGRRLARVSVAAAGIVVASAATAFALEQAVASAPLSLTTATVAPPSSPTATANCPGTKRGDVLVRWTASTSTFVTGYTVSRSANGALATVVASLPATATSYDDTAVTGATTYVYTIVATYRAWTSSAATATATTAKHC